MKKLNFLLCILVLFYGCKKENNDEIKIVPKTVDQMPSDVALQWYKLSLKLSKETPGFSPPVAARAFAYTGITLYESLVNGMENHNSLQGLINGLVPGTVPSVVKNLGYHWEAVANSALYHSFKMYYKVTPQVNHTLMDSLFLAQNGQYALETTEDILIRSNEHGKMVSDAVYQYSVTDGQDEGYLNNFPTDYIPPVGPGMWEPTPPAYQRALQPYWGNVRVFVSANIDNVIPLKPPLYSTDPTSLFYSQALEVYTAVKNVTPAELDIAKYWSDDPGKTATPPGHSISVLVQVTEREKPTLTKAAKSFALLGMGVHDAFVSCWKCKYEHSLIRPLTYIHREIDSTFTIPLNTPPFPEYTSGHSVQSGAMAQILSTLYGYNYSFYDATHVNRTDINGTPRFFNSFFDMADEAAISRLYGGIHYRAAIDLGVDQGKSIGKNIMTLNLQNPL